MNTLIPSFLKEYARRKADAWAKSLVRAELQYVENVHFVIGKEEDSEFERIQPVDFGSTGIVKANNVWSNGLHQFLQIKHGLRMTPEGLTTSYFTNTDLEQRLCNKK